MNQRLTAPRALTALVALRAVRFATITAIVVTVMGIIVSATLAYFFTPWWWLLATLFIILFGIFLFVRIICMVIVRIIHPNNLTARQTKAMNEFVNTIQEIIEARSTPLFFVALICIKDVLVHRDIVTIKKLVKDTARLRSNYAKIEKLFTQPGHID